MLDVNDLRTTEGRDPGRIDAGAAAAELPARSRRRFLWDKTAYVFGVERSEEANEPIEENRYREAIREYHKICWQTALTRDCRYS